jgi:putative transferase (TIGR04331 family)
LVARTLITTADERTWPKDKDEPVLFLGEWCKRYSRRHIWESMNYEVAFYHWNDRKKFLLDYRYIQNLNKNLLIEISKEFNKIHKTDHSVRFWQILVGPWLGYFIEMLFDRWFMLQFVIGEYELSNCYFLQRNSKVILPNDMKNFTELYDKDSWNESIYAELLLENFSNNINLIPLSVEKDSEASLKKTTDSIFNIIKSKRKVICNLFALYNKILPKQDRYFFISTYMPLQARIKLQLHLRQLPKNWCSCPTPVVDFNAADRMGWSMSSDKKIDTQVFDRIIRKFIPNHVPKVYLEGYKKLIKNTVEVDWPQSPEAIFTSNSYASDDFFKCWAATKVELGTLFVIAQHGGGFGMSLFSSQEEHQIAISDKWLSWGWVDNKCRKVTPVGNIKVIEKKVKRDSQGGVLMVVFSRPRYSCHLTSSPMSGQWLDYFNDQTLFVSSLPKKIQKKLVVRLKKNTDYGWDQEERWKGNNIDVEIDNGVKNIDLLIRESRLLISTYNASIYLECFSLNIPVIMFWNCQHWELRAEAKPFFDLLESVGIFHKTPESAARQASKVWDDVDFWWESDPVQQAIKTFSEQYTAKPKDILSQMKNILIQ